MSGKPVSMLRPEGTYAVKELGNMLGPMFALAMEKIGHDTIFRNCSMCEHWVEGRGCGVYQALPPVKIIVCGCDKFKDNDEIPF